MNKRTRAEKKARNKHKAIEKLKKKYGLGYKDAEFFLDNGVPMGVRMDPAYNVQKNRGRRSYKFSTDIKVQRALNIMEII